MRATSRVSSCPCPALRSISRTTESISVIEEEVFVTRSASRPTFSATLRIDRVISVIEEEVLSTAAESPSALPATCSTEADISSIEEELSPAREKRFSTLWTTDLMLAFICSIDEETVATAPVCPEPPSAIRCETSAMSRETTSRSPNAVRTFSNIARRFAVIRFSVAGQGPEFVVRGDRDRRGQVAGGGDFGVAHQQPERAAHEAHDEEGEHRHEADEGQPRADQEPGDERGELALDAGGRVVDGDGGDRLGVVLDLDVVGAERTRRRPRRPRADP